MYRSIHIRKYFIYYHCILNTYQFWSKIALNMEEFHISIMLLFIWCHASNIWEYILLLTAMTTNYHPYISLKSFSVSPTKDDNSLANKLAEMNSSIGWMRAICWHIWVGILSRAVRIPYGLLDLRLKSSGKHLVQMIGKVGPTWIISRLNWGNCDLIFGSQELKAMVTLRGLHSTQVTPCLSLLSVEHNLSTTSKVRSNTCLNSCCDFYHFWISLTLEL